MRWRVTFRVMPDMEVEVEGDDRWGAVVGAAGKLGLDKESYSMSALFSHATVKKVGRKKRLAWWEKEVQGTDESS